jgi:hypothetical protein
MAPRHVVLTSCSKKRLLCKLAKWPNYEVMSYEEHPYWVFFTLYMVVLKGTIPQKTTLEFDIGPVKDR